MASAEDTYPPVNHIVPGASCLLNVMDDHFLVRILAVENGGIHLTFPGQDYPIQGMRVYLEFHDEDGFYCYPSRVVRGPEPGSRGLLVGSPERGRRTLHRASCRIPTDLTVQVRDQVHLRRYDAALINLSSGGALLSTEAPFDFSTTVELCLSLPGEPSHCVLGQVVHMVADPAQSSVAFRRILGLRFLDPAPDVIASLNRFLTQRLKTLYAAD